MLILNHAHGFLLGLLGSSHNEKQIARRPTNVGIGQEHSWLQVVSQVVSEAWQFHFASAENRNTNEDQGHEVLHFVSAQISNTSATFQLGVGWRPISVAIAVISGSLTSGFPSGFFLNINVH